MNDNKDSHWEIIAAKLHRELNHEEEAEFNQLMSDNANLLEFGKAQQIHTMLTIPMADSFNPKAKSWTKIKSGIRSDQLSWIKVAMKYAAIIVVTFMMGNLLNPYLTPVKQIRYSEITVPFGQMSQLTLSDGTKIWLNSGTKLTYPEQFAEDRRTVSITGEAYFEVAKMQDKPFIVNTSDLKVQVFGTSFNISAYPEDITSSVTLVEGSVAIQDSTGKTITYLHPEQMATKIKNNNKLAIENVKSDFYSAWIAGKIFFDDEPLDQIAVKLERWYNVEIIFANEHLKSRRFTGTILKNKPVDQIMQALELLAPIRFKHQVNTNGKDKITIYKRI